MTFPARSARAATAAPRRPGQPWWLASVRNAEEAAIALAAGAAVIDAKEPRAGALGALPGPEIAAIVARVAGRAVVSATTGDLPLDAALLAPAMRAVAAAGANIVKIGVFGSPDAWRLERCLAALPDCLPGPDGHSPAARVAVLMADQQGADWPLAPFARHGFAGVMLDTADKRCGGLRTVLDPLRLARFVTEVRALGLWAGLAGSLSARDIPALAALDPDYLGFRTALCCAGERSGALDPEACRRLAEVLACQARPTPPPQDSQAERPSSRIGQAARRA